TPSRHIPPRPALMLVLPRLFQAVDGLADNPGASRPNSAASIRRAPSRSSSVKASATGVGAPGFFSAMILSSLMAYSLLLQEWMTSKTIQKTPPTSAPHPQFWSITHLIAWTGLSWGEWKIFSHLPGRFSANRLIALFP